MTLIKRVSQMIRVRNDDKQKPYSATVGMRCMTDINSVGSAISTDLLPKFFLHNLTSILYCII